MSFSKYAKNPLVTGTLLLTIAGVISRIIGFFYKIFLSRTIGAEGLGIYQLVFPVMALSITITSSGIQTAISRFVSGETSKGNEKGARQYLYAGIFLSVLLSLLVGFFLWNNADYLADHFLNEPRCAPLLKILAYSLLPCSIHACINGYFYGLKKAFIPSLSQLLEQVVRVGSAYLLYQIYLSKNLTPSISLAMWGLVFGEFAGMLLSLSVAPFQKISGNLLACTKHLLSMAVPLSGNRIVLNLFASFENIMIPNALCSFGYNTSDALSVYGIMTGMALAIIMFPTVVTNSVSVLLLPLIAEAQANHDKRKIQLAIKKTVESCVLLGLLCTTAFLLTGRFIGNFIFANALAGTFIRTLSWICPFLFLSTTLSSILHGLGHPGITFLFNVIACIIRILFVLFAIPLWGIRSYLIGMLISQLFVSIGSILYLLHLK